MASGFFALLDDIAILLDDVGVMSKIATKKTAGILGDDLAVNAEKATGFVASREIPVLWAITKGSFINKLIILPIAFLLSAFLPWTIIPILVLGGIYLAYEGAEKIYHFFFPHKHLKTEVEIKTVIEKINEKEILNQEKKKIKSAIVTDFILSIEIVIIALGTVVGKPIFTQIMVVSIVAIIATIGVYGIVALIVRMDDIGYRLIKRSKNKESFSNKTGLFLVKLLPKIIRFLSVVGTIALILVSGGIFVHHIDYLHYILPNLLSIIKEFIVGLIVGLIVVFIVQTYTKVRKLI
ncbi:MAG: DUF808 domain-containing protein [Flavobacteriaceae bacterium]|nr:DUF808 domain-containing protein [Flavobacteriaceae bacterium]